MPLTERWDYQEGMAALWETTETVSELEQLCTEAEVEAARKMAAKRALGFLSWRALLHTVAPGIEAGYDTAGGPVVAGNSDIKIERPAAGETVAAREPEADCKFSYIGTSHTAGYAAVILGQKPCAIDIESFERDISRLAGKFSSDGEAGTLKLLPPGKRLTAVWCAKEALFKLHRESGIDFRNDIEVTGIEARHDNEYLIQAVFKGVENNLHYRRHENLCVVFVWK